MNISNLSLHPFLVSKMFEIHPTKSYPDLSKEELNDGGDTPFVVNSAENNGIGGYSTLEPTEQGGIITFSDTTEGNTFFYQDLPFIGFSHVQGMYPLTRIWTRNESLFLATILTFVNDWRFNYGRKMTRENILNSYVSLPSTDGKEPDWEIMNNYINELHDSQITQLDCLIKNWK